MLSDINTWRTIALILASLGQTAFVLLYFFYPWWKTFLGRALFGKSIALVVIMDFAALSRIFKFGHDDIAFTILYALLAIGVWFQFVAFVHTLWTKGESGVSGNERETQ